MRWIFLRKNYFFPWNGVQLPAIIILRKKEWVNKGRKKSEGKQKANQETNKGEKEGTKSQKLTAKQREKKRKRNETPTKKIHTFLFNLI